MMTKMKKMNVLNYQVTRFARDNNFITLKIHKSLMNFERRRLGMMTKMKKMNVLNYQVTRFARDNKKVVIPNAISMQFYVRIKLNYYKLR